jgi:hypothetical protein
VKSAIRLLLTFGVAGSFYWVVAEGWADELRFIPDAGVRVTHASNPIVKLEDGPSAEMRLTVTLRHPHRRVTMMSQDGLAFSVDQAREVRGMQGPTLKLPDGAIRRFFYDPQAGHLLSEVSGDGVRFSSEPGVRYTPHPTDHGTFGVYDVFLDRSGGVVLLYVGDMHGLNNIRRAYSNDAGMTFHFERADVLGDAEQGGGPQSFVDHKVMRLSERRFRLFAMRQGVIYSFLSTDDGTTFRQEPGVRLAPEDFDELDVRSLHDPTIIRLPDGRYRMYVCAKIVSDDVGEDEVIVSATTH